MFRGVGPYHERRKNQSEDAFHRTILLELVLYVPFLVAVTIVTLLGRTFYMYYFYDMIQRLFIKRYFYGRNDIELVFEEIGTVEDWWGFVRMVLQNGIQGQTLGDGKESVDLHDNIFLGPPRLRQLRVRNGTCIIHKELKKYFSSCYGAYTFSNEDILGSKYNSPSQIDSMPYWGLLSLYRGGGYIEQLTFYHEKNEAIIDGLVENLWIKRDARLVIFEFALFNANANLFCIVKFFAEIAPIGGVVPWFTVQTYRLTYLWAPVDYFYFVCYGIFIIQIIYFSVEEVTEMYYQGCKYLTYKWNYLDLTVIVIGYLSLAHTIFRFFYMDQILEKYNKNPKAHLSLDFISLLQFHYNNMMGVCAFLVWIKIFKYLSFSKTMIQFGATFSRCSKDLFAFGLMFAIAFIAFAQLGYLLFGTETEAFKTFTDAVFALMRTLIGDFEYGAIERANRILGPIFFLVYIVFVFFILLNMFVAIIIDTYSAVKEEETTSRVRLGPYIKKIFGKMCKWCCCGRDIYKFKENAENADASDPNTGADKNKPDESTTPRQKNTIEKYFEEVDPNQRPPMDKTELNRMNQRIQRLEDIMDRMVTRLDALVSRLDNARVRGRRT